jgi:PGF-pre-PGF domain-containing protein
MKDKHNKKGERAKKSLVLLISLLLLVFLELNPSLSSPVPLGIDGRVYHLDGNTEVMEGIPISITNLDTNETIKLETGRGSSGRYSIALKWSKGSNVEVKTYNPEHEAVRNITLTGIIHDFDLLLNMTLSPMPPEIITDDLGTAKEDEEYTWQIEVFDWNQDNLTFFLEDAPKGMRIQPTEGKIEWLPTNDDVGEHKVILVVRDEYNSTSKNLSIRVENVNDPPKIVSQPKRNARIGKEYTYNIVAEDEDVNDTLTFSLIEHPIGMAIRNKSTIIWTPNASHTGKHNVSLRVEDKAGESAKQEYLVMVPKKGDKGKSGQSGGGSGGSFWNPAIEKPQDENNSNQKENKTSKVEKKENRGKEKPREFIGKLEKEDKEEKVFGFSHKVYQIEIKNKEGEIKEVRLKEPDEEEIRERKLNKIVYDYIEIETNNLEGESKIIIRFKIEKKWLERWNISKQDIVLEHYNGQEWEELPTSLIDEQKDYIRYEAKTNSHSLFAITHKDERGINNPEPSTTEVDIPNIIFGSIEGVKERFKPIRIFFTDLKEEIKKEALIREINSNTSIYEVEFEEELLGEKEYELHTKKGVLKGRVNISDSKTRLDFDLDEIKEVKGGLNGITGNFFAGLIEEGKMGIIGMALIVFALAMLIFMRYYFNRRKNE